MGPEHVPGADNVPWPLLIRARYQFELDAVVASTIVRNITALGSESLAKSQRRRHQSGRRQRELGRDQLQQGLGEVLNDIAAGNLT